MAVVFTCEGAELREAGGESFSTTVPNGKLTISQAGAGITIDLGGSAVPWVASAHGGPFKRVDTRSFMLSTTDLMSFSYVTLPKGLPDSTYEHLNAIFEAAAAGQPLPTAAPAAAAPAAAAAAVPADGAAAPAAHKEQGQGGNPLGDFMAALARKAAHDTQMLGGMIQQKAAHDINQLQQQKEAQHPKPADA